MSDYQPVPEGKDPVLWDIAQKRAGFKRHLLTYIIVNTFLWILWYFNSFRGAENSFQSYPWPLWSMLGWGIGLAFHFAGAYILPKSNAVENEYQKLKNKQQ